MCVICRLSCSYVVLCIAVSLRKLLVAKAPAAGAAFIIIIIIMMGLYGHKYRGLIFNRVPWRRIRNEENMISGPISGFSYIFYQVQ